MEIQDGNMRTAVNHNISGSTTYLINEYQFVIRKIIAYLYLSRNYRNFDPKIRDVNVRHWNAWNNLISQNVNHISLISVLLSALLRNNFLLKSDIP
jgi:hypothetical protein